MGNTETDLLPKVGSRAGKSPARDKIRVQAWSRFLFCLHGDPLHSKALTLEEAILRFGREKGNDPASAPRRRVVFTNGCFDLLHPGHLRELEFARAQGDLLIVGLNSDSGVRRLKGPGRPLMSEGERAEILSALESVDGVVIFDEPTPREVIARLLPDVLVKGEDWPADQIVGREEVEAVGGKVVRAPILRGFSTTEIIQKIRQGAHASQADS